MPRARPAPRLRERERDEPRRERVEPRRERAEPRRERGLPPLRVRYWRRMKRGKIYQVSVTWDQEFVYRGPPRRISVRLSAGGAQVVPEELPLHSHNPDAQAVFTVTPLAKGWLTGQKLEVIVDDRKVQEIELGTKVVTRRRTWFYFLMIFLGPWLVANFLESTPFEEAPGAGLTQAIADAVPPLPGFIGDSVPNAQTWLNDGYYWIGYGYEQAHLFAVEQRYLPFYVGVGFFLLTLLSLWFRRDKRKWRVGNPLFVPKPRDEDEED